MGACLSSQKLRLKSIEDDIVLQQYEDPVKVAQVVSESDLMDFNEYLSPPDKIAQDEWQLDGLYFVLPSTKLQYPLRASEMAVNGALPLQSRQHKPKSSKRKRGSRVMSVTVDGRQLHKPHFNRLNNSGLLKSRIFSESSMHITSTRTKFGRHKYKSWWSATLSPIPEHFAF
ncbi:hypothetical protein SUGI_0430920 [Cryptomeria japonica]|nr:hypothetical protein SUGI_0430920 [Cryptomeria japonica]